jgi:hypothetical protein
MRGREAKRAIFLAIRDSDTPAARKRRETLQEEAAAVRAATGLGIEAETIDMLPKRSATRGCSRSLRSGSPATRPISPPRSSAGKSLAA